MIGCGSGAGATWVAFFFPTTAVPGSGPLIASSVGGRFISVRLLLVQPATPTCDHDPKKVAQCVTLRRRVG